MKFDKKIYVGTLEALETSYAAIVTAERKVAGLVNDDSEGRDEIIEAFRRYREAHHKLSRDVQRVVLPHILVSSSQLAR